MCVCVCVCVCVQRPPHIVSGVELRPVSWQQHPPSVHSIFWAGRAGKTECVCVCVCVCLGGMSEESWWLGDSGRWHQRGTERALSRCRVTSSLLDASTHKHTHTHILLNTHTHTHTHNHTHAHTNPSYLVFFHISWLLGFRAYCHILCFSADWAWRWGHGPSAWGVPMKKLSSLSHVKEI